jgi:uncharacterized protein (DUF58 family)
MQSTPCIVGKTRLLFILVVILSVLSIIDDYQGWRFLLLGLGGAWGVSYAWTKSLAKSLTVQREIRFDWAQVGDQLEERITLMNAGGYPALWIELRDGSNLPGYKTDIATGLGGNSSYQWTTRGICSQRGLFMLGPTSLLTSDPLGLYSIEIHDPRQVTLMVTPPIVPLPDILVAPGGRAGQGHPKPNAPERTVSASSVRQYLPGDSLRHIHWRTSARRDDLFVHLFDSTPSGDWWIILDADQAVQVGEAPHSTEEHGIILAASLADQGLRLGKSVGLAACGDSLVWLPPREAEGQRWEILRSLAVLKSASHPFGEFLDAIRPSIAGQASLVLITSNTTGSWIESLLPYTWQGSVPTVLLLDPASFGGQGRAQSLKLQLAQMGIYCRLVTPDLLDRPEAHPGHQGRWEWRVSPTGKAIPVMSPRDISWRGIS